MVKFDFRGSRIGSQFIAAGDAVFDQRGQVVGSQTNVGGSFRQSPSDGERAEFLRWWRSLRDRPADPEAAAWLAWRTQASGEY